MDGIPEHPRSRALQQRILQLNSIRDRLDLDQHQNDELQQLHHDVQAKMVTLLANGLNLEDHKELERKCGLYRAYLHDETTRAGLEEIRTLVQQTEGELREWAAARVNLHRDFIDGLRDRMTDVTQRLNSLTDPDNGTVRRFRRNIRDLQDQVADLRDENEGFHALRDEMATLRRDVARDALLETRLIAAQRQSCSYKYLLNQAHAAMYVFLILAYHFLN
jgi:DNA repair exonuclease SbcCD ATPase subunit